VGGDRGYDSSGRMPTYQPQDPEFNSQYLKKKKKKATVTFTNGKDMRGQGG
jgi:hypothetical protein